MTSTINTDFNTSPYYDDYDQDKQFARILFRPGRAVQARELTQLQTIIQQQVRRFGEHVFKMGSIVTGGLIGVDKTIEYVKINDLDASGADFDIDDFVGVTFTGATSGVTAFVELVEDGTESATNKKTLFVRYTNSGTDGETKTFSAGETINSSVGNLVVYNTTPTGKGLMFFISEGSLFAKDHFLYFPNQKIIVSRYSTTASARIGFNLTESLVTSDTDESLLDPALGSSNYFAQGADRFKIAATLTTSTPEAFEESPDYIELAVITDGEIVKVAPNPDYNILKDELARRTEDESGDYLVNGFSLNVRENLDNGENNGLFTLANGGNIDSLSVGIEPGLAYVKGYKISTLATTYLEIPKAKTFENVNEAITTARLGRYVTCNEFSGTIDTSEPLVVSLYDTTNQFVTSFDYSSGSPTGNVIGTAKVKSVKYNSGTLGTPSGNVNVYLFDILMNGSNSFSSVRSLYANNDTEPDFSADVVLTNNLAALSDVVSASMLYYVGTPFVRSIRDASNSVDLSHSYLTTSSITVGTTGVFNISSGSDSFTYGTGALSTTEKNDFVITIAANRTIDVGRLATGTSASNTVTANTSIFGNFNVGDKLQIANTAGTYRITEILSATQANVTPALSATVGGGGNALFKYYLTGDTLDLNVKGVDAGTTRTVTGISSSQVTVDLKETLPSSTPVYATYKLSRSPAREIAKTLNPNRYVQIDCSASGTTGPFNLGFSDLYQVREIRLDSSPFTSATQGSNVTSSFIVDNGQRDDFYDHAKITPKISLSSGNYILVKLDYFSPDFSQGASYFSVDSYPIDDNVISNTTIQTSEIPIYVSSTTGDSRDLRNFLDFRPVKENTANDSITVSGMSSDPANSNTFLSPAGGIQIVAPTTQINYDYSYYLPRNDIVCLDQNGVFSIVQGVPAATPVTPSPQENTMQLGRVSVSPYPSIAPNYAVDLKRRDLAVQTKMTGQVRYTMRDIGVLKNRIESLEYYVNLNALEKAAIDLTIPDENGLDRLKNGIFVDPFNDHTLGDTTNPDYTICVDSKERCLRPVFLSDSINYEFITGSGVTKTGDLITLPYTEETFLEQPRFTTFRNVEDGVYRFIGRMYLDPETDVWNDTLHLGPNEVEMNLTLGDLTGGVGTNWNDWESKVVGYDLFRESDGVLLKTYSTYQEAWQQAQYLARNAEIHLNDIGYTGSKFRTYIEERKDNTRFGVERTSKTASETVNLGTKVVDVEFQGYIPARTIKINAKGLKGTTRLYTFFDGEDMSSYVFPANSNYTTTGAKGSNLISDSNGEVYAILQIPANRFRVGTKEVKFTDNPNNNDEDATTTAVKHYVHYGLIQQKQQTILSTKVTVNLENYVFDKGEDKSTYLYTQALRPSCSAYTFYVNAPEGEEGIFLSSVDVYFQAKSSTLGVWFEIREMNSAGGITRTAVPMSEVWYTSDEVPVSADASLPLNVKFPSPVFLYNNTQYAFVIHTEGINPDYYFWVSRLGQTDLGTNEPVTSRPLTGTFYVTNNNLNWDMLPDVDLKVKFNRAKFTTGSTGTIDLGNKPIESLTLGNASGVFNIVGEPVKGYDQLTVTTPSGGSISVGEKLGGANSNVTANVTAISGSTYRTDGRGFLRGEPITVYDANSSPTGVTTTVATISNAFGTLRKFKQEEGVEIAQIIDTSNTFYVGDYIKGQYSNITASVDSIETEPYYLVNFAADYLVFNKTSISAQMRSVLESSNTYTDFASVDVGTNSEFVDQRVLLSRTTENTLLSGRRSNEVRLSLSSSTDYMSPVVDVSRTHSVYVRNIINDDDTDETNAFGGNLLNKYISKTITLADGQDAEDMKLYVTAYVPPTTNFKVYIKLLHREDSDLMSAVNWIEMEKTDDSIFSSKTDTSDFREFELNIPAASLTGPNGEYQYTNSAGTTFTGFKFFKIKVALTGTDKSITPKVADLRSIALQL